jgi:Domain of unknown function (DUF6456)
MTNHAELRVKAESLLKLLRPEGRYGRRMEGRIVVVGNLRNASVRVGSAEIPVAAFLVEAGLVRWEGIGNAARLTITEAGASADSVPTRSLAADELPALARPTRLVPMMHDGVREEVRVHDAESPLAWLHRRRDSAGQPFIDAARFAAGERLRADLTMAGMLPRVTADWSKIGQGTSGARSGALLPSEAMMAAQQRTRKALAGLGPDMAGLLIDLCGFLKSLDTIEKERRWPARSAKVVVKLALGALAQHYGLSEQAQGRATSGAIRQWGADDYRPELATRGSGTGVA